jgi:probable F420-dependent oxidoreductase
MRFHQGVAFMETDQILEVCRASEQLGYAGVYVSDHIFYPKQRRSRYPYSPFQDGSPVWGPETDWPEPFCLISAAAAVTSRLTFTTGAYIAPARDLFSVAKLVGTAACLSGNRVLLGVGAGWCEEEFAATGQDFSNRGKRLDDMIPALRALWSGGWVSYEGSHYRFGPLQMNPSPSQPVPVLGAGHSAPALERTARLCDGWLAASAYQPEEAWRRLDELKARLARHGRPLEGFRIYMAVASSDLDLLRRLEDAGVTDLICAPWMAAGRGSSLADKLRAIEGYASAVVSRL